MLGFLAVFVDDTNVGDPLSVDEMHHYDHVTQQFHLASVEQYNQLRGYCALEGGHSLVPVRSRLFFQRM